MPKLLDHNSYQVLGLGSFGSQKEILKRSKEIVNRLKIDDVPEYDFDFADSKDLRTEEQIKDAVQKLSAPTKRIKEYFFWFQLNDEIDEQALDLIKQKEYEEGARVWESKLDKDLAKTLLYKKNLAVLYTQLLYTKSKKSLLEASLNLWKELIESEKFWAGFNKLYKLHDDLNTSQEVLDHFRENISSDLSDLYSRLGKMHDDATYFADFTKLFEARGEKTKKNVLDPIYNQIVEKVEKLESMKISEDGVLDKAESEELKKLISGIQGELNKLIDYGVYDDSQSKSVRDRTAEGIRQVVLDLHNNLNETEKASALLNVALKICGTASLETRIKQDLRVLEEMREKKDIAKPVLDLIAKEKYEEALKLIEVDRVEHKHNADLQSFYDNQKKISISAIAIKKFVEAKKLFDNKNEDSAQLIFEQVIKLIYNNLSIFNFNKKAIDDILAEIESNLTKISVKNLNEFDKYRETYIKLAKEKFEGQFEETILIVLIDSKIWGGLTGFMKKLRSKASTVSILNTIGWFTIWFYGIGIVFFIAAAIYKNKD